MPGFEWNDAKSRANKAKHGISFEAARSCWNGPMLIRPDTRFNYGEPRWIALALLDVAIVVIVYTERGDTIRLISVRKADKHERKIFSAYFKLT